MLQYTIQRIALALAIVFVAISALFGVMIALPGDPTSVLLGPRATPEIRAMFREQMGLDDPVLLQILRFWGRVLGGDLGTDFFRNRPCPRPSWARCRTPSRWSLARSSGRRRLAYCWARSRRIGATAFWTG